MSRVAVHKGFAVGVVLVLAVGFPASALPCSVVSSGPTSWSPLPNGVLPVNAPLLLAGVAASASTSLVSATGERMELTREPAFGSITFGARYGFFRPAEALEPNAAYVLESSDGLSVPFETRENPPRIQAILSLKTELKTMDPYVLSSGQCYVAPFIGREVARYAEISATIQPWAPLILSVRAHDDESSSDVEQTLASHTVGLPATLKLELPLPSGVDDCPHVQVLDYAGQTLLDVPQLCLAETSVGLTESVEVFDPPQDSADTDADPQAEPRATSSASAPQGCALGASPRSGGVFSLMLAMTWLNRRAARRRIEKPSAI